MFNAFTAIQRGDAASILDAVRRRHESSRNLLGEPEGVEDEEDQEEEEDEEEEEEDGKLAGNNKPRLRKDTESAVMEANGLASPL
jgi:hypothetical protein